MRRGQHPLDCCVACGSCLEERALRGRIVAERRCFGAVYLPSASIERRFTRCMVAPLRCANHAGRRCFAVAAWRPGRAYCLLFPSFADARTALLPGAGGPHSASAPLGRCCYCSSRSASSRRRSPPRSLCHRSPAPPLTMPPSAPRSAAFTPPQAAPPGLPRGAASGLTQLQGCCARRCAPSRALAALAARSHRCA